MSLIFRMLIIFISSIKKQRLPVRHPKNTLRLRVLPNDLDINFHMNNGRYLTICDLTRLDMFIRTGLMRTMLKNNWRPLIVEHTMTYKKSLRPFQKYQVHMDITGWDDRAFDMQHKFLVNDTLIAEGTSKGVIYCQTSGVITPEKVMEQVEKEKS